MKDSRTSGGGSIPHHKQYTAIDIGLPSKNKNTYAAPRWSDDPNTDYDREMTIKLIEGYAKNVPLGKKLIVYFNDPEVIKKLNGMKDNNGNPISIEEKGGHDDHVHVGLR